MITNKFDNCEVVCEYCKARYFVTAYEDEIPSICKECVTPSLRVIQREALFTMSLEEADLNS